MGMLIRLGTDRTRTLGGHLGNVTHQAVYAQVTRDVYAMVRKTK